MGVTNSNKVINTDRIECDGSLRVTLALTAAPDIVSNPTDIVLALDRSGSMTGEMCIRDRHAGTERQKYTEAVWIFSTTVKWIHSRSRSSARS